MGTTNQRNIGVISESRESWLVRQGEVHILPFDATDPAGADDNFAYLKNDSDIPIEVLSMEGASTVAGIVKMERCTGTVVGGTAVVPIPANGALDAPLTVTFEVGVNITGLTDAGVVGVLGLGTSLADRKQFEGFILAKDEAVLLNWSAATGILTGLIRVTRLVEAIP